MIRWGVGLNSMTLLLRGPHQAGTDLEGSNCIEGKVSSFQHHIIRY